MSSINTNPLEQAARMETTPESASSRRTDIPVRPDERTDRNVHPTCGDEGTDRNVHPPAEEQPSPNGSPGDGRDQNGRFAAGNKGGPGNPFAREVARIRKRLQAKLTDEQVDAIVDALMAKASAGDVAAAKLLFSYGVGKPAATVDPDQLDVQEWQHWKSTARMMYDLPGMIKCIMPDILLEMVRMARPLVSADLSKTMGQALMNPESVMPPPMPDLVMGRSDKPLRRGAKAPAGDTGAADPRGSEYLASGLEVDTDAACGVEEVEAPRGVASEARRRAWGLSDDRFGLPPTPNGNRGGKKDRKKAKRPSPKGDDGRSHGHGNGAPSRNGVLGG